MPLFSSLAALGSVNTIPTSYQLPNHRLRGGFSCCFRHLSPQLKTTGSSTPHLKRADNLGTATFPGLIKRWQNQPCCPSNHHKYLLAPPSLRRREGGREMGDCQRQTAEYTAQDGEGQVDMLSQAGDPQNSSHMSLQPTSPGYLPHREQVGQPVSVREAVTAERMTQWLVRESDILPHPPPS